MKGHKVFGSALVALVLAGCGGGGHSSSGSNGGGNTDTAITFAAGDGYNGSTEALKGTLSSVGLDAKLYVTLAASGRTLSMTFPKRSFSTGDRFEIGTAGAMVEYDEAAARAGDARKWLSTSGTLSVTNATASKVYIKFDGVNFQPTTSDGSQQAAGTFTANGTVSGFPNEAPTSSSTTDIRFSSVTGDKIDTTAYPSDAIVSVTTVDDQLYYSVGRQVNSFPASQISFKIPKDTAVGEALTLGLSPSGARAYLFQLSPSINLQAVSGTVTIVSKSATSVNLRFSGVLFKDTLNSSSDSVVVDGSFSK